MLHNDLYEDWDIFWRLSSKRRIDGMSGRVEPILYSEIEAYMRIHRIDEFEEQDRLVKRIEFMDILYCNHYNTKKK